MKSIRCQLRRARPAVVPLGSRRRVVLHRQRRPLVQRRDADRDQDPTLTSLSPDHHLDRQRTTAPGVLDVGPEPAREPRNRSERQSRDRFRGESLPTGGGSANPANAHGAESARAADPIRAEVGADGRDLEERLSIPPRTRCAHGSFIIRAQQPVEEVCSLSPAVQAAWR